MGHHCKVPDCDGTRLGHDLAVEFPAETARIDAAFRQIAGEVRYPGLRVNPENLRVEDE